MTELLFYHLEQQPVEEVLPLLLEKTLERDWRAVVQGGEQSNLKQLDIALWSFRNDSFLPHARIDDVDESARAKQPILLCSANDQALENHAAHVRFFVTGARPFVTEQYERLVYMFDGHDPQLVQNAREDWKNLKSQFDVTYWQQAPNGRWEKKA